MSDEVQQLRDQIGALLSAQVATVSRLVVLEDAFVVLATKLARTAPNPVAALETYIAELEAAITTKKGLQGGEAADAAFHVGSAFDNLVHAMRERVPSATGNRSAN